MTSGPLTTRHVPAGLLTRYAAGDPAVDDATVWAVETHLERCAACRAGLEPAVDVTVRDLLDQVQVRIDRGVRAGPGPARAPRWRRLAHRWAVWSLVPWLAMTTVAMVAALALDLAFPHRPSLVLLLAPVAPLTGIAAAWSRRTDAAWETVAATPRAGLELLLRRAVVVLVVVIPVLAAAGWYAGQSPARWLLPCLAFTSATLLLGGWTGVTRAAGLITVAWVAAVVAPSMATSRLPLVVSPASAPGWLAAAVTLTALVVLRGPARHGRLRSWR